MHPPAGARASANPRTGRLVVRSPQGPAAYRISTGGHHNHGVIPVTDRLAEDLKAIEEIAKSVTAKEAADADQPGHWPEHTIRALQAAGLGGFVIPTEHGGRGHGLLGLTRACEILGRESAPAGLCFGMHNVGAAVLAAKATPYQVETYVKPICEGRHVTTLSLSEPGTGLHFYYPQTELQKGEGNSLIVRGTKSLATNGGHADSYVVSTKSLDPNAPAGLFSCVMVPGNAPGIEWGPIFAGMGMRGNCSRGYTLNDVRISRGDLLGEDGDQLWYVFHVVAPFFLVAMAGTYVGLTDRAITLATEHLGRRTYAPTGKTLGDEPVLQHRLGSQWAVLERTRQFVYWAAKEAESGGPKALPALCSAKAEVADCAVNVVNECLTLCGGIGYRDGAPLDRLLRDSRAAHVMAPTTDILRTWAGRALLGRPLLE